MDGGYAKTFARKVEPAVRIPDTRDAQTISMSSDDPLPSHPR